MQPALAPVILRDPFRPSWSLTPLNAAAKIAAGEMTFSRGTLATQVNADGSLTSVAAGTLRVADYSDSASTPGIKIEPQATNLWLNSEAPATQSFATTAQTYTLSVYGAGTITLSGSATGTLTAVGSATTRTTLTFTASTGTLTATVSGLTTGQKAQLETGTFATSYIPTANATVTRGADLLNWLAKATAPSWSPAIGTYVVDFSAPAGSGFQSLLDTSGLSNIPDGASLFSVYGGVESRVELAANGSYPNGSSILSPKITSGRHKIGAFVSASNYQFFRDGSAGNLANKSVQPTVGERVAIGAARTGAVNFLNGSIYRLDYYRVALPPSILQRLTA